MRPLHPALYIPPPFAFSLFLSNFMPRGRAVREICCTCGRRSFPALPGTKERRDWGASYGTRFLFHVRRSRNHGMRLSLKIRTSSNDFLGSLSEGPEKCGKRDMASKECRGGHSTPDTRHSVLDFPPATLLPGGADCVLGDQGIGCQERHFMLDGLANQYPVKWVAVKQWQL